MKHYSAHTHTHTHTSIIAKSTYIICNKQITNCKLHIKPLVVVCLFHHKLTAAHISAYHWRPILRSLPPDGANHSTTQTYNPYGSGSQQIGNASRVKHVLRLHNLSEQKVYTIMLLDDILLFRYLHYPLLWWMPIRARISLVSSPPRLKTIDRQSRQATFQWGARCLSSDQTHSHRRRTSYLTYKERELLRPAISLHWLWSPPHLIALILHYKGKQQAIASQLLMCDWLLNMAERCQG